MPDFVTQGSLLEHKGRSMMWLSSNFLNKKANINFETVLFMIIFYISSLLLTTSPIIWLSLAGLNESLNLKMLLENGPFSM